MMIMESGGTKSKRLSGICKSDDQEHLDGTPMTQTRYKDLSDLVGLAV